MVELVAKAKALILGLLASAATTAATVDLTLPPGDYMLVPVQPYTVVTIQSTPVDLPVQDTDGDGVNDDIDQCPDTPLGDEVDATGCTVVPLPVDSDGDGITDAVDQCPDQVGTPPDGCPDLPPVDPQPPAITYGGNNIQDCIDQMEPGSWCEIDIDATQVFRTDGFSPGERGTTGPRSAWSAYSGAAFNYPKMWFHGGGHNTYGGIDVWELDLELGTLERIYTPPPYNVLLEDPREGEANEGAYAWRHDPSLPVAMHAYDGALYDPQTGLIIYTKPPRLGYTYGFSKMPDLDPDDPIISRDNGTGIYAFNPSATETIKGVAPRSWRRLVTRQELVDLGFRSYQTSEYLDGKYYVGDDRQYWVADWQGDEFVIDPDSRFIAFYNYPPITIADNGLLHRLINGNVGSINPDGTANTRWWEHNVWTGEDQMPQEHGFSLAMYGDDYITWNGSKIIQVLDTSEHKWRICDYSDGGEPGRVNTVYSKWVKHPQHDDIFIGWDNTETGPMIYRHDPNCGYVHPGFSLPTLNNLLKESDEVTAPADAIYWEGPTVTSNKTLDFNGAELYQPAGNGFVVVDGDNITLKNLFLTRPGGRAGVWAMPGSNYTIDGFDIVGKNFGFITANDGGNVVLRNGVVRDGSGSSATVKGRYHNYYFGTIDSVIADNIRSIRHDDYGHLFKSRAATNIITNSYFDGEDTRHSRVLDFPCGGHIEIRNSQMIQSPNSDNPDMMSIAVESCMVPETTLILEDTYWEANKANAYFLTTKQNVTLECQGTNTFVGLENPCDG